MLPPALSRAEVEFVRLLICGRGQNGRSLSLPGIQRCVADEDLGGRCA